MYIYVYYDEMIREKRCVGVQLMTRKTRRGRMEILLNIHVIILLVRSRERERTIDINYQHFEWFPSVSVLDLITDDKHKPHTCGYVPLYYLITNSQP